MTIYAVQIDDYSHSTPVAHHRNAVKHGPAPPRPVGASQTSPLRSSSLSSSTDIVTITMARTNTPALRGALRGTLRNIRARPVIPQQRLFGASARCSANDKQSQQPSFKSQLYESTQQRLKRERAEQERFAQYQQTQSPGGRYAAMMFGMPQCLVHSPAVSFITNPSSSGLLLLRRILLRIP